MSITREEVLRLAELSNFELSETEISEMQEKLGDILAHISKLDEVDTEGVEPTYQVFEMENVWREDEIEKQLAEPEELVALSPENIDNQIKVPKVL